MARIEDSKKHASGPSPAPVIRSRDRWGFSYITVHEPYMPALAPVIERLRGE
jgi:hypothetical protein